MDITLVPPSPEILPGHDEQTKRQAIRKTRVRSRSGYIRGQGHDIILRGDKEQLKIEDWQPLHVKGKRIHLRNETGLPIKLTETSRNCKIITNGTVTDNGDGNEIKQFK